MNDVKMAADSTADREITATRLFDAPRDLVWKAFTELEHIEKWWGPDGFTTTTYAREVRPGGVWRFVMHGPDRWRVLSPSKNAKDYTVRTYGAEEGLRRTLGRLEAYIANARRA
jgi:hypothetical protein